MGAVTGTQAKRRAAALRARAAELLGEAQALEGYARELERQARERPPTQPAQSDLVALARARGMSLRDLARRVGCSHALLSLVGSGRRAATPEVAARLADLVGWRGPGK